MNKIDKKTAYIWTCVVILALILIISVLNGGTGGVNSGLNANIGTPPDGAEEARDTAVSNLIAICGISESPNPSSWVAINTSGGDVLGISWLYKQGDNGCPYWDQPKWTVSMYWLFPGDNPDVGAVYDVEGTRKSIMQGGCIMRTDGCYPPPVTTTSGGDTGNGGTTTTTVAPPGETYSPPTTTTGGGTIVGGVDNTILLISILIIGVVGGIGAATIIRK